MHILKYSSFMESVPYPDNKHFFRKIPDTVMTRFWLCYLAS